MEIERAAHDEYMGMMWRLVEDTVFKDAACIAAHSYYIDRHGDASLPLPSTPWKRDRWLRRRGTAGYRFGP